MASINVFGVYPFSTIDLAFVLAQLSLNSKFNFNDRYVIFHNVAPRKDNLKSRFDNDGEALALCILPNGVIVVGVLSGYAFSYLQHYADIYILKCPTYGSQFRSRDIFPKFTLQLLNVILSGHDYSDFLDKKSEKLPNIPNNVILYKDGYGNLKTNLDLSVIKTEIITLYINGVSHVAKVSNGGIFSVKDGDLVLSYGSSGWNNNRFTEIVLRGGSAAALFSSPQIGTLIEVI